MRAPLFASSLAALLWLVALAAALSAGPARAEPVYFGAAARGPVGPEVVQRTRAALERAVARQGVKVLDTSSSGAEGAQSTMARAKDALDEATRAWAAEDWATSLTASGAALKLLETELLFVEDDAVWALFRDVMSLRALVYLQIRKRVDALDAVRALLAVMPRYAPNPDKAPPELLEVIEEAKDEIRALPPAPLELQSKPAGATVIVDGRRRGKTPLLIEDVVPGVHWVVLESNAGRHTERVVVDEVGARVTARIGTKKGVAARDVLRAIERPTTAKVFVRSVEGVDDDGLLAVILPAGKKVEVIGARVRDGEVKVVCGVRIPDNDNDRDRATFVLVEGLLEKNDDAWLDLAAKDPLDPSKDADPSNLRGLLFAGMGTTEVAAEDIEEEPVSPAAIAAGIVTGALAVAVAGTIVGISVYREIRKDEGFTFGVDTQQL